MMFSTNVITSFEIHLKDGACVHLFVFWFVCRFVYFSKSQSKQQYLNHSGSIVFIVARFFEEH